jgi:F0F1-type ATP synthase assembly protein I
MHLKDWRSVATGLLTGTLTGIVVGLGGFFLATTPRTNQMGIVMFFLVPFCAGFAIALVTRQPNTAWAAMLLAVLVSLTMLVAFKREGILCALLALPLLAFGLAVGAILGYLFRRYVLTRLRHQSTTTVVFLLLTPVLIFAGHDAERQGADNARRETVSNSIRIQAPAEEVWTHIQSLDSIDARKPWLMHFGLPVPLRCSLERKGVGAKRTCYFENGFIEEIVTEWAPPYSMRLTIDRTNMPGRHWLGFESAAYELRQDGDTTVLTRTTIITSHLYPVWYWRYFERLGVASEHEYIFSDLANRMAR